MTADRGPHSGQLDSDVLSLLQVVDSTVYAHQEAKKLYADRLAPDFSVFEFIGADEMKLSTVLAWLLDPDGTHGQGSTFLDLLMHQLGLPPASNVHVSTEFSTENGRFDILIKAPDRRIVIENKPWAGEQLDQIANYVSHLVKLNEEWKIVYLTPNGTSPASINKDDLASRMRAGQILTWAYQAEIIDWLERCAGKCNADRVATFIKDFVRYIRTTFQGIKDLTVSDHLLEEIVGNSRHTRAASQVFLLIERVRTKLVERLVEEIQGQMPDWQVTSDIKYWNRWSSISIKPLLDVPYRFRLEFEASNLAGLAFGLFVADAQGKITREDPRVPRQDQSDAIVRVLGPGNGNAPIEEVVPHGWLWWRRVDPTDSLLPTQYNWANTVEPWVEIAEGTMAKKIVTAANHIFETMKEAGLTESSTPAD